MYLGILNYSVKYGGACKPDFFNEFNYVHRSRQLYFTIFNSAMELFNAEKRFPRYAHVHASPTSQQLYGTRLTVDFQLKSSITSDFSGCRLWWSATRKSEKPCLYCRTSITARLP